MSQLKIIRIRGQCRGRPPTPGANRDGPESVVGRWSLVVSQVDETNSYQYRPAFQNPESVGQLDSWQLVPRSEASSGSSVVILAPGANRARDRKFVVGRNAIVLLTNDQRPTTNDLIQQAKPRDWISATCSQVPITGKNRRNKIMAPRQASAEIPGTRHQIPDVESLELWNNGTVELWNYGTVADEMCGTRELCPKNTVVKFIK